MISCFPLAKMEQFLRLRKKFFEIKDAEEYQLVTVQLHSRGIRERSRLLGSEIKTKKQQRVKAGDLMVAEIDAKVGGYGIVPSELDGAIVSGHYFLYEIDQSQIEPDYLGLYLKTGYPEQDLQQFVKGSVNYAAIRSQHFFELGIPLPPLDDQHRIVERIQVLTAKVRELETLQNGLVDETEALWASRSHSIFNNLQNTPLARIGDICDVQGGLQKSPSRQPKDNPIPYLTVAHVQRNHIDLSIGLRYFEVSQNELQRLRLLPGDLLIIEGNGSLDQIGRVAVFNGEVENCVHQNHVIRARPNLERVLPNYLNAFLNSPAGQEEVQKRSRTTSGLRTLSVGKIREIEVPLPSLGIQQQLVKQLQRFKSATNDLLIEQAKCILATEALIPTILNKAFIGTL